MLEAGGSAGPEPPCARKQLMLRGFLSREGSAGRQKWSHSLVASIHLGSQSVVGASVHEVRKWVEGEREGRKATEVVHFEM